jgi:response regulator of citrate/malate metabolism
VADHADAQALAVLVVEDEPVALEAHAAYVGRVVGFTVAGTAATSQQALRVLDTTPVDVVLLDMNLPDRHGLDVIRAMRAAGHRADVIAVTSARELEVVRSAVSLGVVQYILKPFVFATLRDRLEAYRDYRAQVRSGEQVASQDEVDQVVAGVRPTRAALPKGMSEELLGRVTRELQGAGALSATELAERLGVSRVTARRYAEHLSDARLVTRSQRYAGAGRPEIEYRWN